MHVNLFLQHVYSGFNPFSVELTNYNSTEWNGTGSLDCIQLLLAHKVAEFKGRNRLSSNCLFQTYPKQAGILKTSTISQKKNKFSSHTIPAYELAFEGI